MEFMTAIDTAGISGNRSTLPCDGQSVRSQLFCASVDRDRRRAGKSLDPRDIGAFDVRGGASSHAPADGAALAAADLGNPVPRPERRQQLPIQIQDKSRVPPGSCERRRLVIG
ncbi:MULTISPECIES: hypothetical protein [Prauserella salsuginis group]|uniref:Uncharacterized protein n=2 Tax=Prauserella salsuginis group TaxID=2893672 RepID=A0A839XLY4_9PSEU|nr:MULTISPECIES: hypothetical protein [Prauserella salsuginis group]MBB3661753.1 hypothetical protein [Prauserella sediminis]MCR3719664.1 hypothetical protein [Prauserella flava]MCR3735323.1 hypothetical protein [Prauserella salsuginis]